MISTAGDNHPDFNDTTAHDGRVVEVGDTIYIFEPEPVSYHVHNYHDINRLKVKPNKTYLELGKKKRWQR